MAKKATEYTISQVCSILGISDKTMRRWIAADKIEYRTIQGARGKEYRITRLPTMADATIDSPDNLDKSWDMLNRLQQENMTLAGQLGAAQERVRILEEQVKLLTGPRVSWWQRLFKRNRAGVANFG